MFKATKEFLIGDAVIAAGQEVVNPTQRMQDLGLVVEVQEVVEAPVKTEKPKKEKKEETKVEETAKTEILTEQSSNVTVEKTEEKTEE
jgi:hypothetical protein